MISKDLFERFISNGTTPEESAEVMEYLRRNPEALDALISDDEWEQFRYGERLHPAVSDNMLGKVRKATYRKYPSSRRIGSWIAAAVAILLIGFGWMKFGNHAGKKMDGVTAPIALQSRPVLQHKQNNTGVLMSLVLKDGSRVELYPHSGI